MANYLHLLQKSPNHSQLKIVKSQVTGIVCTAFQHQNDGTFRSEADKLYRVLFHKPSDLSIVDFPISPTITEFDVVLIIRAKADIGSYCGIPCVLAILENNTWFCDGPMGTPFWLNIVLRRTHTEGYVFEKSLHSTPLHALLQLQPSDQNRIWPSQNDIRPQLLKIHRWHLDWQEGHRFHL